MNKQEAKQAIIKYIESIQGCKATELVSQESLIPVFKKFGLYILQELVDEKQIIEFNYVLPSMSYREKSFYLPKGTKVKVDGV